MQLIILKTNEICLNQIPTKWRTFYCQNDAMEFANH